MKKLISLLLVLTLLFACVPAIGSAGAAENHSPCDEGLSLYPDMLTLPMYSAEFGERLYVFYDGMQLPASLFDWSSSDTGVLTVTPNGFLTPVAPGNATVTVSDGSEEASCTVTVVEDDDFPRLQDIPFYDLSMPFYSEEVGIGPLGGGEPVIIKRFINPPSCSQDDPPDPNDLIPSEGWVYTYAVVYRFYAHDGDSFVFSTGPSGRADAAQSAYVAIYDMYFNLWSYSKGTSANPFGTVTLDSYEDNYFYVVIMPVSHTADGGSGTVRFYAYEVNEPYALGDADMNHVINSADALLVLRASLGLVEATHEMVELGDVNGNGRLDANDALALLRHALGIEELAIPKGL